MKRDEDNKKDELLYKSSKMIVEWKVVSASPHQKEEIPRYLMERSFIGGLKSGLTGLLENYILVVLVPENVLIDLEILGDLLPRSHDLINHSLLVILVINQQTVHES